MASLYIGDLLYEKDFRLGPETRTVRDNGDHSFHTLCFLYGGTPFQAIILGVLKGVVRLNDTDKFAGQEQSLTRVVEMDRARRPRVVLSERSWVQDTVMITTCALTKMNFVESGANAGRATSKLTWSFVFFALGFPFMGIPLWERQRGINGTNAAASKLCHTAK
ncbi:hypothetical protein B0H13DRAFT_1855216 [Mycena leptocephala]|nr:hypothetical protein B0H13DRAFT_1855216 [Mycena leptocephala]